MEGQAPPSPDSGSFPTVDGWHLYGEKKSAKEALSGCFCRALAPCYPPCSSSLVRQLLDSHLGGGHSRRAPRRESSVLLTWSVSPFGHGGQGSQWPSLCPEHTKAGTGPSPVHKFLKVHCSHSSRVRKQEAKQRKEVQRERPKDTEKILSQIWSSNWHSANFR